MSFVRRLSLEQLQDIEKIMPKNNIADIIVKETPVYHDIHAESDLDYDDLWDVSNKLSGTHSMGNLGCHLDILSKNTNKKTGKIENANLMKISNPFNTKGINIQTIEEFDLTTIFGDVWMNIGKKKIKRFDESVNDKTTESLTYVKRFHEYFKG